MVGGCSVAIESQTDTNQPQGNPPASYALILGILSLVISGIAFLPSGSAGVVNGGLTILFCAGVPGFSLVGLLAAVRGLRASKLSGQGQIRALAGMLISLAALVVFAFLVTNVIALVVSCGTQGNC